MSCVSLLEGKEGVSVLIHSCVLYLLERVMRLNFTIVTVSF